MKTISRWSAYAKHNDESPFLDHHRKKELDFAKQKQFAVVGKSKHDNDSPPPPQRKCAPTNNKPMYGIIAFAPKNPNQLITHKLSTTTDNI